MTGRSRSDDRGLSPVVGYVLLVGIVALGSITVVVVGSGIFDDGRGSLQDEKVENAFREFATSIEQVSLSGGNTLSTKFPLPDRAGTAVRKSDTGRIWVNKTNLANNNKTVLINRSLGAVRYKNEDTKTVFGYQNGAVFKNTGNGTEIVSNPQLDYSVNATGGSPTLTLPIIDMTGAERLSGGNVVFEKTRTNTSPGDQAIAEGSLITVTIKSEWYVGWADYFRSITREVGVSGTAVIVDHDRQTATLRLVSPFEQSAVIAGIVGTSPANTLGDSNNVDIDSYDSSKGPYPSGLNNMTRVITPGNLTLGNGVYVDGNVDVGGTLTLDNNPQVTGDACSKDNNTIGGANFPRDVDGDSDCSPDITKYEPVDDFIATKVDLVTPPNEDVNNSSAPINNGRLFSNQSTWTLYPGNYYLDEIDLNNGDTLVLKPQDGEINIVVDGPVNLKKATIDVKGSSGRVNFYINSTSTAPNWDLLVSQSVVEVPDDRSDRLWVYMKKDARARLEKGGTDFHGVIFGPGNKTTAGTEIEFGQKVQFWGAVVGDVTELQQNTDIHYDRALTGTNTIPTSATAPKVTYINANSYVVEVTDEDD